MVSQKPRRNHSALLINEPPLQVLPSLAKAIGLHEAIFAQQLHYWLQGKSGKVHDGRRWVYNTREEWQVQFPFWSKQTITRTTDSLKTQGILLTTNAMNKSKMDRTLWYTLDYDRLDDVSNSKDGVTLAIDGVSPAQNGDYEIGSSNHETTQETTTENTQEKGLPLVSLRSTSPTGERVPPIPMGFETEGQRNARLASERQRAKRRMQ